MSTKSDTYLAALNALESDAWDAYLRAESGLPGPRGNLELAHVAADLGSETQFRRWLAWDAIQAPTGDPGEFLAFCGTVGMGRLLAGGWTDALGFIRAAANDPRWRQREAAAMALQRLGAVNMPALLDIAATWAGGTLLERRAAAAALAEPALLADRPDATRRALDVLETITAGVERCTERRSEDFKALRKGMGYCWSVVIAALPEEGWPRLERWCGSADPDVRWIMKENLGKTRLTRLDADRVARLLDKLKA